MQPMKKYTSKPTIACQWPRTRENTILTRFLFSFSLCALFRAITGRHPAEDFSAQAEYCSLSLEKMVEKYLKIHLTL